MINENNHKIRCIAENCSKPLKCPIIFPNLIYLPQSDEVNVGRITNYDNDISALNNYKRYEPLRDLGPEVGFASERRYMELHRKLLMRKSRLTRDLPELISNPIPALLLLPNV